MNELVTKSDNSINGSRKKISVTLSMLGVATLFCLCLLGFRIIYAGKTGYLFLVWNLFLAIVPLIFAGIAEHFHRKNNTIFWLFGFLWLLFFPNSPYIVTDFMHLRVLVSTVVPFWFDVMVIGSFAITGILFGLCSLSVIGRITFKRFGIFWSWMFMIFVALLSGFGIYLGRYLRWNSWDIFVSPNELFSDINQRITQPLSFPQTWIISLLFAALILCSYVVFNRFFEYKNRKNF